MLHCYLDDSYTDGSGLVTLAGYVASTEAWVGFERSAEDLFQRFGVSIFHAIDFRRTTGPFKDWTRGRKIEFIGQLFDLAAQATAVGVSVSVSKKIWTDFKKIDKRNSGSSPLGMAFGLILLRVCGESHFRSILRADSCKFTVETGNKNNAGIVSIYERHKRQGTLPNMNSLDFHSKLDSRAIQLADFWAYYSRKISQKVVSNGPIRTEADLEEYIDPELAGALRKIWHSVQISKGPVTKPSNTQVSIGSPIEFLLGPVQ